MPAGFSSTVAGGTNTRSNSASSLPIRRTVAPSGTPRQVREGNYIVTYAPSGAVISRVYSPVQSSLGTSSARTSSTLGTSASRTTPLANQQQSSRTQYTQNTTGGSNMARDNSLDVMASQSTSGAPAGTGSGAGSAFGGSGSVSNANSGINYTGPFAGINDKQADYMVANPLAIAAKVFGIDMANNPTIAGLLSPVLEAAQNPYIGLALNPGYAGVPDQNQELNFAANLLKQYTTPGGSFLSPTAGLRGIQSAMGDPNSALNAVLSTATGEGAAGAAAQLDLINKIMAPFLSMGTGAWGSDIFDAIGYDAYNKYTLGQAATPGLPGQDFLSALMGAYGFPGTLK